MRIIMSSKLSACGECAVTTRAYLHNLFLSSVVPPLTASFNVDVINAPVIKLLAVTYTADVLRHVKF